jgi:hypothetical protein
VPGCSAAQHPVRLRRACDGPAHDGAAQPGRRGDLRACDCAIPLLTRCTGSTHHAREHESRTPRRAALLQPWTSGRSFSAGCGSEGETRVPNLRLDSLAVHLDRTGGKLDTCSHSIVRQAAAAATPRDGMGPRRVTEWGNAATQELRTAGGTRTDCALRLEIELVARESREQIRLTDARVPNQHNCSPP